MDCTAGHYSLAQLLDMLLFADAVGFSQAVLGQLAGLLGSCARAELELDLTSSTRGSGSKQGTTAIEQESTAGSMLVLWQLNSVYSVESHDDDNTVRLLKRWDGPQSVIVQQVTAQ